MKGISSKIKCLNGEPFYIIIENLEALIPSAQQENIDQLMAICEEKKIQKLSVVLKTERAFVEKAERLLRENHFVYESSMLIFQKNLESLEEAEIPFQIRDLEEVGEKGFISIWQKVIEGSYNKPSSLTIEEQFEGMKKEIGPAYAHACLTVYDESKPIGIMIPVIEPGTEDEGRIFYFGIIPDARGKGIAVMIHRKALDYLKKSGASYYIGATDKKNIPMQSIFKKNGCIQKGSLKTFAYHYNA
ncbi:GNAT family N-acetyltransferase [Pseudalkalibacillus caeni]|uniref:GNAT family N-acetyltransferase n=1 Tax=Exobacillus caeni TaxID=2574798 RepID=A0A5R9FC64_9BACL|nr:GNAT family N-acetyltransferase [Pseudalkalibacillus caeni]TLS38144.1 GNAT family N-acetyltransferase [Pseudalkalibacillus caeni]